MSDAEVATPLDSLVAEHGEALLDLAVASVRHGLAHGAPMSMRTAETTPSLAQSGASFVTLHSEGQLRGCIGSARAWRALAADVVANAFATAFEDPRFDPLRETELDALDLDISLLGAPEPFPVASERALVAALVPGRDGLILAEGARRGLFLPAVWEQVDGSAEFVRHLKHKAGMPADYWSDRIVVERFETRAIARPAAWSRTG
jgi:AmmeMemoRadiSam system protein A